MLLSTAKSLGAMKPRIAIMATRANRMYKNNIGGFDYCEQKNLGEYFFDNVAITFPGVPGRSKGKTCILRYFLAYHAFSFSASSHFLAPQ